MNNLLTCKNLAYSMRFRYKVLIIYKVRAFLGKYTGTHLKENRLCR